MKRVKIAIIGGGPAGIATAIQLKRLGLEPVMFEKNRLGGLLWSAQLVENYPGFPSGITGAQLVKRMERQVRSYEIEIRFQEIIELRYIPENRQFLLNTDSCSYDANIVVAATGTRAKTGGFPHEVAASLQGFLYTEIYPLLEKKEKHIIIIGAGDIAFDYALHLTEDRNNQVTVIHRGQTIKALPLLEQRVIKNPRIRFMDQTVLTGVSAGDKAPLSIEYQTKSMDTDFLEADYLLSAVGREPQIGFFSPSIHDHETALLKGHRFYLAGDVKNGRFRQVGIAVGNGIETAMSIHNFIATNAQRPRDYNLSYKLASRPVFVADKGT